MSRNELGRFAPKLDGAERSQVVTLVLDQRFSVSEAARMFGLHKSNVSRLVNAAKKERGRKVPLRQFEYDGRCDKTTDDQKAALISAARSIQYRVVLQRQRVGASDELNQIRAEATEVELALRRDTYNESLGESADRLRALDARLLSAQSLHNLAPSHRGSLRPAASARVDDVAHALHAPVAVGHLNTGICLNELADLASLASGGDLACDGPAEESPVT